VLDRELARLGEEPQRSAKRETGRRRRRQREQQLERRGRPEPDRRNHPGAKQLRLAGPASVVSRQKLRRVLRTVVEGRQQQMELPLDVGRSGSE
jgi:hypothetical protein